MECITTSDKDAQVEFNWMFNNQDLAQEPHKYRIDMNREGTRNRDEVRTVSRLTIQSLNKEHDGKYSCGVDTTNNFLSDEKELKISLHVQYKPR